LGEHVTEDSGRALLSIPGVMEGFPFGKIRAKFPGRVLHQAGDADNQIYY
jgi:hypothetical protein